MCNCSDNRIERASMPVRLNPSTSSANFTTVLDAEKTKTAVKYGEINVKSVFQIFLVIIWNQGPCPRTELLTLRQEVRRCCSNLYFEHFLDHGILMAY